MKTFEEVLLEENENEKYIYIHCIKDTWRAFGRSAYYLVLLYPEMEVMRGKRGMEGEVYVNISNENLMQITEMCQLSVRDECVKAVVPLIVYCKREGYTEWHKAMCAMTGDKENIIRRE